VQQTLNVLESYPMRDLGHNSADYSHLVASALNLNPLVTASWSYPTFVDRSVLGSDGLSVPPFELGWAEVAERRVTPVRVVKPFDEVEHR
jgi:hypothetical protein